jgi:hypothetical protein
MSNTSNDIVVNALIRKRAELSGLIERHQCELSKLLSDIGTIDSALHMFAPHIKVANIVPKTLPPRHPAARGEITMLALNILREAKEPIRTEELNRLLMEARNLNTADKELTKMMLQRLHSSLRNHRHHGRVRSIKSHDKKYSLWEIAS